MTVRDGSDHPLLRTRTGGHARVTYEELFFDLVYVFAVTQLSHGLLHHLDLMGLVQTVILWFAVWLGWQYTCWTTNWFDPETPKVRSMLFAVMLAALVMSSAIPQAFGDRALIFAGAYASLQVGRTLWIVAQLPQGHALAANWRRILGWVCLAATLWIAGAFAGGAVRIALWIAAILCEYLSPMIGFWLPGMGRSQTRSEWTIEGAHLAERCQLFVIVALGETLLATGTVLADTRAWDWPVLSAMAATFLGTLAMWWLYFGASSKDATEAITRSDDPGRIGGYFHYVHVILVAGVIGTAVGNDLVLAHPDDAVSAVQAITLAAGPAVYLLGSAIYKRVIYGALPPSHLAGAAALAVLIFIAPHADLLALGWMSTAVMLGVGFWEMRRPVRAMAKPA